MVSVYNGIGDIFQQRQVTGKFRFILDRSVTRNIRCHGNLFLALLRAVNTLSVELIALNII